MRAFVSSATWVFVLGAFLMWFANHSAAGWIATTLGADPLLAWFLAVLAVAAIPLAFVAGLILSREGYAFTALYWRERLRFQTMTAPDWRAALIAVGAVALGSTPIAVLLYSIYGPEALEPPFMGTIPLEPDRLWLLLAWFPFWIVNILGEEILWRGIVQPRQEKIYGSRAWMINAAGWGIFHIAFGWKLLVMLIPILIVLPWTVQKTANSWTGIFIHAVLNGPSFIAVSLGLF